jgi:hypothetical protein
MTTQSVLSGIERLGLRIAAMINCADSQMHRRVTIHRLDTDTDRDWDEIMDALSETAGLDMTRNRDGSVTLKWQVVAPEGATDRVERPVLRQLV